MHPQPGVTILKLTPSFFLHLQDIAGITFAEYSTNAVLNMNTLVETIAASMVGIATGNVVNYLAAASTENPQSAIKLTYSVQATTVYTSAELINQFSDAVDSGAFNTMLQTNALDNGAAYLDQATSASLVLSSYQPTIKPTARPTTAYPTSDSYNQVSFNGKQVGK
jgi:hypothetical protein